MSVPDVASLHAQAYSRQDANYKGSSFDEVCAALQRNAYYLKWGEAGEPPLPVYGVTWSRTVRGILSSWIFQSAAARALDSKADMRWGQEGAGFRRLLHPNGVALMGKWIIDQPNVFTGCFSNGTQRPIIGRYSTCCSETRRGYVRSLSLVGKIFSEPANEDELQETASFITQQDIGGELTHDIRDVLLCNAPNVTARRRGLGIPVLLLTALAFKKVDREPTIRQLYQIAELEKPSTFPTVSPNFMRLKVRGGYSVRGEGIDFRDEILSHIYDRGNPQPQRKLIFDICVTERMIDRGVFNKRREFPDGWRPIGRIEFDSAVASYNADFVLHFQHPPWRRDVNSPDSVVRRPASIFSPRRSSIRWR